MQPAGKSFGGLTVDRLEQRTECALAHGLEEPVLFPDNIDFGFRLRSGTWAKQHIQECLESLAKLKNLSRRKGAQLCA